LIGGSLAHLSAPVVARATLSYLDAILLVVGRRAVERIASMAL